MRQSLWTIAAVILLAAGGYLAFRSLRPPEPSPSVLYGSGRIESTEIRLASEIPGRIVENHIIEGRQVTEGSELLRLDDGDVRIERAELAARLAAREASVVRIEHLLDTARHHLGHAEAELERARSQHEAGHVSAQELERIEDRHREAAGEVKVLQARHAEATASVEALRQHEAQLARRLDKTVLRSPLDATVLVNAVEVGEVVAPGQTLARLVDLDRPELEMYVMEPDLGKIRLGSPARIRVNAFPKRHFEAEVSAVDSEAQFTPRDVHVPDERARTVFGVTLRIDKPDGLLKPGMPADAWILWQEEAGWPDRLIVPR